MDDRIRALDAWLRTVLPGAEFRLERASADASFRRYFRLFMAEGATLHRHGRAARARGLARLRARGAAAPRSGPECARGARARSRARIPRWSPTSAATPTSPRSPKAATWTGSWVMRPPPWCAGRPPRSQACCPSTTSACCAASSSSSPSGTSRATWAWRSRPRFARRWTRSSPRSSPTTSAQPRVYVHRDYMPRNLMVADPNPGILDFQDAVHGPVTYDVACLFRDAFVSWEEERVLDGTIRYWEKARRAGLPVRADFADFWRDVEWMGLQRHLKVLGIFARLKLPRRQAGLPRGHAALRRLRAPCRGPLPRAGSARARAGRSPGACGRARYTS